MKVSRFGFAAVVFAALGFFFPPAPAHALLSSQEFKCSATVAKSFAKLQSSLLKLKAKCHDADISGKADSPDACDTLPAKAVSKASKAREKFVSKVAKACKSVCSISDDVECVSDLTCPARHTTPQAEKCLGKGGTK
ncbi:MAG: hypothetical protein ABR587_17545, partial [Candidatus Binatia bacterium]